MDFANYADPKSINPRELHPLPNANVKALTFGGYEDPIKAQRVWQDYFPTPDFPREAMAAYRKAHTSEELDVKLDKLTNPRSVHVWDSDCRYPCSR